MSKVTIKLNRKGVRQLLKSPEMENALTGIAFAAQNRLGEGYKASYYKASTRCGGQSKRRKPRRPQRERRHQLYSEGAEVI